MITVPENIKSINPYVPGKPIEELERELGIHVVATVATTGRGVEALKKRLVEYVRNQNCAEV